MDSEDVRFDFLMHPNPTRRVRATHMPTGTVVECSKGASWKENKGRCLAELRRLLYANDQRLSGLPMAEQLVAIEFLSLHDAWATEFEACYWDGELTLLWRNPNRERKPLADWDSLARFEFTEGYGWGAFYRAKVPEPERAIKAAYREDAVRWNSSRAQLRYLPEFAAFVKRFVPGEVQS